MKQIAGAMPRLGEFISTMQPDYATIDDMMEAHHNHTVAEIKHDGYRVQVHRGKSSLKIFTRNGNELNYDCYPDVVQMAKDLPTCIIDAELVGEGNNHKEVFDRVKQRFRRPGIKQESVKKYLDSNIVCDVPLNLRIFDMMRFEKKGLLHLPFEERTSYVESIDVPGIVPVDQAHFWNRDNLEEFIDDIFVRGQEGIVCKDPSSKYMSGHKGIEWVKFKRSETLDLVVVGFYKDEFMKDLPFTGVLVASYNNNTGMYETLGKISTTRNMLSSEIYDVVQDNMTRESSKKVVFSEKLERQAYSRFVPDMYINPDHSVVLEVKAMNLNYNDNWQTCGEKGGKAFSMRIGWANQLRPDKSPRQATTTETINKLYKFQGVRG